MRGFFCFPENPAYWICKIDKLYDIAMKNRGVDVKCLNKTDKTSDDNNLIEVAL